MNKIFFYILSLCLILVAFNCKDNSKKIDPLFSEFDKSNTPSASIMVIKNGEVVFKKSYGFANLEEKIKADENTHYRLASVTKQFTAMCIMILQERGKLKYENTLKDIFPDFPEYGKTITIKNILQHTSGILAYDDTIPESVKIPYKDKDVYEMMTKVDSTYFPPNTKYRYSNTGYAMLAMIVEKVSGKKFREFLKENIFDPLGMNNTVAHEEGITTVANRAYGYSLKENNWVRTDQSMTSAVLGDGGIYCSPSEYYKWDQALYTEKLVSKKTLTEAFTSGILNDGSQTNYGFGWRFGKVLNYRTIEHSGSTIGFSNYISRIPDKQLTVIAFTNKNDFPEIAKLVNKIMEMYLEE